MTTYAITHDTGTLCIRAYDHEGAAIRAIQLMQPNLNTSLVRLDLIGTDEFGGKLFALIAKPNEYGYKPTLAATSMYVNA
jgi:hypothetical protein